MPNSRASAAHLTGPGAAAQFELNRTPKRRLYAAERQIAFRYAATREDLARRHDKFGLHQIGRSTGHYPQSALAACTGTTIGRQGKATIFERLEQAGVTIPAPWCLAANEPCRNDLWWPPDLHAITPPFPGMARSDYPPPSISTRHSKTTPLTIADRDLLPFAGGGAVDVAISIGGNVE